MTRSTPSASGRWFTGVAKVPSMIRLVPGQELRTRTKAERSATRRYGFVGDSARITFVRPGRNAARSASSSPGATNVDSTPSLERNLVTNCRVRR